MEEKNFFTNKYTNIAKGIAVLALLFHHIGLNAQLGLFEKTSILYKIASQCKVCVAIFLILSGYGLNASLNNKKCETFKEYIKFSLKHLLKLMITYWTIFIVFMSIGCISGKRTLSIYENNKPLFLLIDFIGLADLFSTPTYNGTWWFMSIIIILYLLFPLLKLILKHSPSAMIIIAMSFRCFKLQGFYLHLNTYLIVFCLGMLFSEFNIFDRLRKKSKSRIREIIITIMFLVFGIYSRYKLGGIYDIVAAFSIIFASNNIFANIKWGNDILELLGKNSANIFMFHTFIYKYFFIDYFKKLRFWWLIYVVLIIATLLISIIIEKIKKILKIKNIKKIIFLNRKEIEE